MFSPLHATWLPNPLFLYLVAPTILSNRVRFFGRSHHLGIIKTTTFRKLLLRLSSGEIRKKGSYIGPSDRDSFQTNSATSTQQIRPLFSFHLQTEVQRTSETWWFLNT